MFLHSVLFKNQKLKYMPTNRKFNSSLFAKDFIAKRQNEQITVRKVSEKTGLGLQTINRIENGDTQVMSIENIVIAANYIQQPITKYF